MRVRLLSLNVDKTVSFSKFQARIVSSIKMYSEGSLAFEQYENMRGLFGALQDAMANDELIITAVDTKNYLRFKKTFIGALETEIRYDSTVMNLLEQDDRMEDELRREFSAFPEPAEVFPSKDGLYSGFGIENGTQYMIFVPVDNERIDAILRNGVVPYLGRYTGIIHSKDGIATRLGKQRGDEPAEAAEAPETREELPQQPLGNEKVVLAVDRLLQSNSVAAVNGTQNSAILKSCGDFVEHFDDVFIFTPYVEDKGEVNPTEYSAQLAKVSLDLSAANIGASISDIYTSGDVRYICIAVANDESAVVRKLYMSEDETETSFVESAAVELIELIGEKAMGMQSIGIEITDGGDEIPEKEKKPANKKSMIILSSVLGALLILAAVFGIVYKVQGENGSLAKTVRRVFGVTETTPEPSTEAPPEPSTEPPTEAQKPIAKVKLSEFMIADLINLEKNKNTEAPSEEPSSEENSEPQKTAGAPKTIKVNGEDIEAHEALARLVMTEMGEGYNYEAVKAQTVVIYTYLKYRDNNFEINGVEIADTYSEEVKKAVDAVFGEYLSYKDEVAVTPYYALAARRTTDGGSIFSQSYPYLKTVMVSGNPDSADEAYKVEKEFTLGEFKAILLDYDSSLKLPENASEWVKIQKHDSSVSSSIGYVTKLTLGEKEMSGYEFRTQVLGTSNLASHCFTVTVNDSAGTITVTSYGSGIGVGMSKCGANDMAGKGTSYKKILSIYFNGTTLSKDETV